LSDAEQFRNQIIHEISTKLTKIQNPGLHEHAVRDLNDEINKLFREKYHWNKRIKELGGPDYNRLESLDASSEDKNSMGKDSIGTGGYRYFGRAKDLPGVRESFAHQSASIVKKKRGDVYKYITPEYYGWKEDEDLALLKAEEEASKKRRQLLVKDRQERKADNDASRLGENHDDEMSDEDEELYTDWIGGGIVSTLQARLFQTDEILAQILLDQKKKDLLDSLEI
jgi:pre-mRNA-splicing factor ISY1